MSHSLRAKIKGLRYKGIITDKDCDRLCKALDNEGVLDKIRVEIKDSRDEWIKGQDPEWHTYDRCLQIIDKYKSESEVDENDTSRANRSA